MNTRPNNSIQASYAVPALLALAGLASRLAFMDPFLFNMDNGNFVFAIKNGFDMSLLQPHPPGYFLYVMLGDAAASAGLDATVALSAVSILSTALYIPLIYAIADRLYGRETALAAGIIALFSPLLFIHGIVGLSYIVEAVMAALVAWLSLSARGGDRYGFWLSAAVLGLSGGFRQTTIIFMYPLWLYCIRGMGIRRAIYAHAVVLMAVLGWLVPMVMLSGGITGYLDALRTQASVAVWSGVSPGQTFEFATIQVYIITWALAGALLPLLATALARIRTSIPLSVPGDKALFLFVWVVPAIAFFTLVISRFYAPGYGLVYMGALYVAAGRALVLEANRLAGGVTGRVRVLAAYISIIVAVNTVLFFTLDFNFSYKGMKNNRHVSRSYIEYMENNLSPGDTVILGGESFFINYRQPGWYLTSFETFYTSAVRTRGGGYYLLTTGGRTHKIPALEFRDEVRHAVFFGRIDERAVVSPDCRLVDVGGGVDMAVFDIGPDTDVSSLPDKVTLLEDPPE